MSQAESRAWSPLLVAALETLRAIHAANGITIAALQRARHASRSTIYRDLDVIKRAGWILAVDYEPGGRALYRLDLERSKRSGRRSRA